MLAHISMVSQLKSILSLTSRKKDKSYIQCINDLSPSTVNKWKLVLQALLTHIHLTNECVICMIWVKQMCDVAYAH